MIMQVNCASVLVSRSKTEAEMSEKATPETKKVVQQALQQISELKTLIEAENSKKLTDKLDAIAQGLSTVQL